MSLPAEVSWGPGERRHAEHGEDVPRAVAGGRAQDAGLGSRQVYNLNIGRSNVRLESVKKVSWIDFKAPMTSLHLGGPPDTSHLYRPAVALVTASRVSSVGEEEAATATPASG